MRAWPARAQQKQQKETKARVHGFTDGSFNKQASSEPGRSEKVAHARAHQFVTCNRLKASSSCLSHARQTETTNRNNKQKQQPERIWAVTGAYRSHAARVGGRKSSSVPRVPMAPWVTNRRSQGCPAGPRSRETIQKRPLHPSSLAVLVNQQNRVTAGCCDVSRGPDAARPDN